MGSSFNGWVVGGEESSGNSFLQKGGITVYEDINAYNNDSPVQKQMRNRVGYAAHDCNPFNFSLYGVAIFLGSRCDGNHKGFTASTNTILDNKFNDRVNSLFVHPGWHVVLYESADQDSGATCIYGSVTNLNDYLYPNTNRRIINSVSALEISNEGICPAGINSPLYINTACSQVMAGTAINSPPCLPEITSTPTRIPDNITPTVTPGPTVPADAWRIDYFNDLNLGGGRCNSDDEWFTGSYVFREWGDNAPVNGCNQEFTARIWRQIHLDAGTYNFHLFADDHARFELHHAPGGNLIIDQWDATQHNESRTLPAGDYGFVINYRDTGGAARINLWWDGPGFPAPPHETKDQNQWYAAFWPNTEWFWDAFITYNDGNPLPLNKNWGDGSVGYGLQADNFSSKYERTYRFDCGDYRFHLDADDYAELDVWDLELDRPVAHLVVTQANNPAQSNAPVSLQGKNYEVRVKHKEFGGGARLYVNWTLLRSCPTPTASPTNSAVPTDTPRHTDTPIPTPTPSNTPVNTTTSTSTPTPTFTSTPTFTPTNTRTPTPTATPTLPQQQCGQTIDDFCAQYYANRELSGEPVFVGVERQENRITYDWGMGSPGHGLGADNFSIRWTGIFAINENGEYVFTARADDGIRVWVNNNLIIDAWRDQGPTTYTAEVSLQAGDAINMKVEYYDSGWEALAQLSWALKQNNPNYCVPDNQQVALFVDSGYGGACVVKAVGNYANPTAIGLPNDSISSLKVGSNVQAQLCQNNNLEGNCKIFATDTPNLEGGAVGNDQVSSLRVQPSSVSAINVLYVKTKFQTRDYSDNGRQNIPVKAQIKTLSGDLLLETDWLPVVPEASGHAWGTATVTVTSGNLIAGQSYQIFVTGAMHLARRITMPITDGLTIDYTDPALNPGGPLWACDINQDNQVTEADYNIWLEHSRNGDVPPTQPDPASEVYRSDQNGDGRIDTLDFNICASNQGKVGDN